MQVSGNEAIVGMVALDCGIGIVPQLVLRSSPFLDGVRVLDVTPELDPFDRLVLSQELAGESAGSTVGACCRRCTSWLTTWARPSYSAFTVARGLGGGAGAATDDLSGGQLGLPVDEHVEEVSEDGRRVRRRGVYLLPNLLTTGALFAGFYAIVASMNGQFGPAAIAIFVAMLL